MPPKGGKRTPAKLGHVRVHYNGFRVQAGINGTKQSGPCRKTVAKGELDLRRAQMAQPQEQYFDILRQLHQEVQCTRAVNR